MGVTDYLHTDIFQFFGITPMDTICHGIANNGKVLMTICPDQWLIIRFAVQPKAVFPFKLNATDTDTAAITINHIPFFIADTNQQVI